MAKIETEASMLMYCCALKEIMVMARDGNNMNVYRSAKKEFWVTRKQIATKLRARGYERLIEIDGHMEALAREAHEARNELSLYIVLRDRNAAHLLSRCADDTLLEWQKRRLYGAG